MPIEIIVDPKTGEERRVYVSSGGMGTGGPPKPRPQPQPPAGGGFMGTLNDFNPMKQIGALGTGVSTFLQTGDLNKSIAAASREAAPTTGLGQSVNRTLSAGGQRAADAARYEVDRARLAREQVAAGTSPLDVQLPSTGPGAPSAQRVRLPGWANYDDLRVEPKNPVEDVAASILGFVPYFAVARQATGPAQALVRGLPGVSQLATGFETTTAGLKAAGGVKKVAGIFAEEAVSGAIPGAIATYFGQNPTDKTLSDGLYDVVKGTPWEPVVAKGLLTNPNDTVEQARIKQSINDLVWSVPLGGGLGTGFAGIGAMTAGTKRAFADVMQRVIKVGQADQAVKDAATAPAAATVDPSVPSAGTPAPRVVSGKPAFSSEAYGALRRQPLWETPGVVIQPGLEPQARAPQPLPVDSYTPKLNYSDVKPDAGPLNASGKRYAKALAGQDQIAIEVTSQKLRASFNNAAAKLGIELGPNANSQSWSMWDIGKQLYMDANPAKSNKPYVLGNPLTNIQVQADIVDRALGFEITKGVDVEGKRYKSWQLTEIGRKAREDAGIELGLVPDPDAQRTIPAPSAPPTPEAAAAALQQAQADLVTSTQRLQTEAAREVVTAPEAAPVPPGQLPGMNQPSYEQVGSMATADLFVAPKVFQYKAEGQFSATGQPGSLAEENVYDPVYAGTVSVWEDKLGELGPVGQVYIANGHNRYDLALRSGAQFMNVFRIDAATAAEARVVAALQNIKDNKGTAIDAGKLLRDTGMSVEDLRLQNVNLNGKLASEGVALSRIPQWLFDKTATGDLPTANAVALGSAEGIDDAIVSDVAKQAIAGKWSAEKIVQAMQEAKFASTSTAPVEGTLPGFEEMFKTTNVVNLIDIRTAAFNKLSVEMRALAAASQSKNTPYLESAGNTINVEGSQAARKMAAEAVAVFNRVTAYEGPVRDLLNELAAQLPEGANRSKAAANLVQFNLQRLRDAISEEMNGPRLIQDEAIVRQIEEPAAAAATTETPATGYTGPLEAENLADARSFLGLPATANVAQVARVAKQEGYDGIVFTGDFGLPAGKREIDLRSLPDVKAPENAGNPVPIQAKPVDVAPVVDNEAISAALERLGLAEDAGDTGLAADLRTWLERRGVNVQVRNQGFGGADFSAELPNLEGWRNVETGAGGTVGEGYTGASRITEREANELARIAFNISGVTDFEVVKRIEEVYGPVQAEAYGDMSLVGQSADLAGLYGPGPLFGGNMADDQIRVAMSAYGVTKSFTQMLSTTYHESFHRLQRWFLTAAEQGVLARSEKAIRELAALNAESLGNPRNAARFRDGTINLKEATAEAFAGFARGLQLPEKVGGIFTKIKELVDQSINFLLSGGKYKTWDDVFEKAALGDMKGRNGEGAVDDGVQFAADPPDPAEFARRIDQNMQALESGDLTPEEITQMGASDVRRLTSRSGQAQYVPEPPDVLIASNKALGEMLTSRAQQTGIGSYSQPAIVKAAMDQLDADGWAVESTTTRLEAARRGDPRSQQDLVALAANLIHRDHIAAQNGMTAIEWQSTVDEADRAVSMQRLWSGLEDQHKLDTALMTASRKDGQRLSVMQIKYDFDPTHRQVPSGTMLYHGTSQEAAEAIIKDGFQAGSLRSNLLGRGVYFAESSMYAGAYGEVAAAGDLPSDVRILDLVSMDKRIADLVQELNLGALEKFEGGLYMTSAQKTAVQDWATGQGYSGIRFSPDFELAGGFTAPETVIFDVNVANRIVGSQAAVEPEIPVSSESMGTDIEAEIGNPMNTILGKIDPDIRSDIERGVMSPEATEMTEVAAQVAISSRGNPGMRAKLNSIVGKIDSGRLNQEMFLQAYRAALLWSPKTWTKMLVGSSYRAVTMPINQAIAETGAAGISALKGDNKAAYRAMRQAGLNMGMYGKYVSNWSNAFRLVGESFRAGESFGNLGASSMDIPQRGLKQYEQTSLFGETNDPANTLDNPWWIDPENMNIPALFAHWGWKALSVSGRVSGSIDTFFSSLIGPSAEWSRVMGLELEKAEGRGLTGDQAWAEASKITDARIENQWVNVILNDRMVKGGAFTGIHAKAAMDWINFTDPLDVQFQPKSYEYGIAKAKEEGITDTAEINKRALAWMQEEPPIWAQRGMAVGQAVGWMPKAFKDAISHTPALGILNPFPTSPANITKAAMRATGVGAPFVDTFYRDVFSEDRNTRSRAIGEIATAYMTLVGGVMLATSGFVEFSGPGSYNPQTKAKMQRLGIQMYSIRIKNPFTGDATRWWDLQALDTVSNIFSLIALQMSLNNSLPKEDREVLASNFVLSVAETARQVGFAQFTKDMYKSMGEIFNLVSELQDKSFVPTEGQVDPFSGYVQRRLAGFMPAIFNNTRKGSDSYQRAIEKSELPQPFAFAHELAQRFAAKIPGLSDQLPPILHPLTGEPAAIEQAWGVNYLPQDQPWLKGAVNAMSPLAFTPTKEGSKDPVDLELGRLSGRGTAFQIWGPNELGIPNFRMNQTQLNKLAVITSQFIPPGRGSTLHQGLSAMVAPGSSYWQLPPPEASKATQSARVIRINKEINYYKPFIKAEFLASEPELARMIAENKAEQTQATFDATYGMQSSWSPTPR
jgi:hypothetical protein